MHRDDFEDFLVFLRSERLHSVNTDRQLPVNEKQAETYEIRKLGEVFKPERQNSDKEKNIMKDEFAAEAMIQKKS